MPTGGAGARRRRRARQRRIRQLKRMAPVLVLALLVIIVVHSMRHRSGRAPEQAPQDVVSQTVVRNELPVETPAAEQNALPEATQAPQPVLPVETPQPEPVVSQTSLANAVYRPDPIEGGLPVFRSSATDEKILAITVDDCFQGENLRKIVQTAIDNGGRLTIFPIGKNVIKYPQREVLKYAWENGFELENHTYNHSSIYKCTASEMAWEIYTQNLTLSSILGVDYKVHFLRPRGGDARNDQRMHAYCAQIGYYGIAHWGMSGSSSTIQQLKDNIKPGKLYLFHTTDKDTATLLEFIPWAVSQGYRLVTMNEMYGYEPNEVSPLTDDLTQRTIPTLQPYEKVLQTYKPDTYCHGVFLVQQQLIDLGYLTGEADGVYGKGSAAAMKAFQKDYGLEETGVADPNSQIELTRVHDSLYGPVPEEDPGVMATMPPLS